MTEWCLLSVHAEVLLCVAQNPRARLRDVAMTVGITERHAVDIVSDLVAANYVVKTKEGRNNRYEIQSHQAMREGFEQERLIGELLAVLAESDKPKVTK
jgi:DNA-binding IclR family transcriptional regulator